MLRTNLKKLILIFACCLLPVAFAEAQGLPLAFPAQVKMSAERLELIDAEVEKAIADKKLPGAVVIVGRRGKIV